MRITILNKGGYKTGVTEGFSTTTGLLTGPLMLPADPLTDMEAATKQYVDQVATSLTANNLKSGTLATARLPAFTGDFTNLAGSNYLTLQPNGVIPGGYQKFTVDSRGRVVSGSGLTSADIPNLNWFKINTGKPTTLGGYGITDAINVSGGSMSDMLFTSADPVQSFEVANKRYVDQAILESSVLKPGVIIRRPNNTTPNGFLRCNGAKVSMVTYSRLYGVLGDAFSYNNILGVGRPWQQQYDINVTQGDDITTWGNGTQLLETLANSCVVVTKNFVYLIGGHNGISYVDTIYKAPINADGTLGTWTTGTPFSYPVGHAQSLVINNRVFVFGGYDGVGYISNISRADINTDGTLGTWVGLDPLPYGVGLGQVILTKDRVYLLGGFDGLVYLDQILTATIGTDGIFSVWSIAGNLPTPLAQSQVVVTKNRVYLLGGNNGTSYTSAVFTALINSDGTLGSWVTTNPLPNPVALSQAIVTKNRVYLFGGTSNIGINSTTYTALLNPDGTIGTWTTGTSIPGSLNNSQIIITKNHVYLLGGYNGSNNIFAVYVATITSGLNDYSGYYDGTILPTDANMFVLPDLTATDPFGIYSFIKT